MPKTFIKKGLIIIILAIPLIGIILSPSAIEAKTGKFDFGLSTSLSEKYDDNIFLDEHDEESDFITSLRPRLSLSYLTDNTNLIASYSPSFEFYAHNPDENDVNHNGSLDLSTQLAPRLNLTMTDHLVFTRGEDIEREELRTAGRISRGSNSDQTSNFFKTTLSYQIFPATSLRGGFSYTIEKYDESEYQESDEYSYELGIDHRLTSRDTIFSNYRYRRIFYDDDESLRYHQIRPGYQGENDTDTQSVSVGISHRFNRGLTMSISGGIVMIDEENEDDETNWNGSFTLNKNFRTGSAGLNFNRSVSTSGGVGGTSIFNTIDLTGKKDFTKCLSGSLIIYFLDEESTAGDEVDNEDWGLILGTGYKFSRSLTGSLSYSFIQQNSKGWGEEDSDKYNVRASLNYLFSSKCSAFCSYQYYQKNALNALEEDIGSNIFTLGINITWL